MQIGQNIPQPPILQQLAQPRPASKPNLVGARSTPQESFHPSDETQSLIAADKQMQQMALKLKPKAATSPQERTEEVRQHFQTQFAKANLTLDAFQPGEGPEQVLTRMNEQGKLGKAPWTGERVHQEAKRIARRDRKASKDAYRVGQQTPLWTQSEVNHQVEKLSKLPKGIDVSKWQGNIRWKEVKAGGIDFAFIKASGAKRDGTTAVDPKFEENRRGAAEAGVATGYYHYFRPDVPIADQVKSFTQAVGKQGGNKLPLVVDVEEDEVRPMWAKAPDGHAYTPQERAKLVDDFAQGVRRELGRNTEIAIYTNPKFVRENLGNDKRLGKYPLWNAHWDTAQQNIRSPWRESAFWQYSGEVGQVAGIQGGVDLNLAMDRKSF